jgi:hypothetical protein
MDKFNCFFGADKFYAFPEWVCFHGMFSQLEEGSGTWERSDEHATGKMAPNCIERIKPNGSALKQTILAGTQIVGIANCRETGTIIWARAAAPSVAAHLVVQKRTLAPFRKFTRWASILHLCWDISRQARILADIVNDTRIYSILTVTDIGNRLTTWARINHVRACSYMTDITDSSVLGFFGRTKPG